LLGTTPFGLVVEVVVGRPNLVLGDACVRRALRSRDVFAARRSVAVWGSSAVAADSRWRTATSGSAWTSPDAETEIVVADPVALPTWAVCAWGSGATATAVIVPARREEDEDDANRRTVFRFHTVTSGGSGFVMGPQFRRASSRSWRGATEIARKLR